MGRQGPGRTRARPVLDGARFGGRSARRYGGRCSGSAPLEAVEGFGAAARDASRSAQNEAGVEGRGTPAGSRVRGVGGTSESLPPMMPARGHRARRRRQKGRREPGSWVVAVDGDRSSRLAGPSGTTIFEPTVVEVEGVQGVAGGREGVWCVDRCGCQGANPRGSGAWRPPLGRTGRVTRVFTRGRGSGGTPPGSSTVNLRPLSNRSAPGRRPGSSAGAWGKVTDPPVIGQRTPGDLRAGNWRPAGSGLWTSDVEGWTSSRPSTLVTSAPSIRVGRPEPGFCLVLRRRPPSFPSPSRASPSEGSPGWWPARFP